MSWHQAFFFTPWLPADVYLFIHLFSDAVLEFNLMNTRLRQRLLKWAARVGRSSCYCSISRLSVWLMTSWPPHHFFSLCTPTCTDPTPPFYSIYDSKVLELCCRQSAECLSAAFCFISFLGGVHWVKTWTCFGQTFLCTHNWFVSKSHISF